ncbi:MAG: murein transglycosylase A [Paracoccaceae bacterium]
MRAWPSVLALAICAMTATGAGAQILQFEDLNGWAQDDHQAALRAFKMTCADIDGPDWQALCGVADATEDTPDGARTFFELFFLPVQVGETPALFTGYYEPELAGSPVRTPRFTTPLYRRPPELTDGQVFHSRAVIESGVLRGRGLEIAWLDDPVEAYFLQIQGSGRIVMPNGQVVRLGYAGRNGHAYQSVGQEMVRSGLRTMDQVSAQDIKEYVRQNPSAGAALLNINPSYVFFRSLDDLPPGSGPIGAMGRSITPMRSVAVDPAFTTLGAPVWIEKDGPRPLNQLMIAQDTGGAIKGPQRADIYFGTGAEAGNAAGVVKDGGRMIVLLPIDRAFAQLDDL